MRISEVGEIGDLMLERLGAKGMYLAFWVFIIFVLSVVRII